MKIRLHGTPDEVDAALAALEGGFEVRDASRPYPDRAPSTLQRVYVDAAPRPVPCACLPPGSLGVAGGPVNQWCSRGARAVRR